MNYAEQGFNVDMPNGNPTQIQNNAILEQVLCAPEWKVQFQPIFSLFTGKVYGYNVSYDVQTPDKSATLSKLFQLATDAGKLDSLQYSLWENILGKWKEFNTSCVLFFPVNMRAIKNSPSTLSVIRDLLHKFKLSPKLIVLDIKDTILYKNWDHASERIQLLKKSGYMIAIGNIGDGYSWVEPILLFCPDYVYSDKALALNINKNDIQVKTLEIILDLAQKLHFQVISKGIEIIDDLQTLIQVGAQLGQGNLLQKSSLIREDCFEGTNFIRECLSQQATEKQEGALESITKSIKTFDQQTLVAEIVQYFNDFELETGVAIVQDEEPVGLVMRERLFQRLAFKYGYSLYWNREIANLMDREALVLESNTALDTASRLSMSRHREKVYDLVIVTRGGKLAGAVAIKDMLNAITKEQVELARDANPLTGLPGNRRIDREIEQRIETEQPFTLVYVDLDHFKWFNDNYGFQRGDIVISFTANILRDCLNTFGQIGDFVGHIGGDDFILILGNSDVDALCEAIISQFDHGMSRFYSHSNIGTETYIVTDRTGRPVSSKGVTISLSVLDCNDVSRSELALNRIAEEAGRLKKMAKNIHESTSVRGQMKQS